MSIFCLLFFHSYLKYVLYNFIFSFVSTKAYYQSNRYLSKHLCFKRFKINNIYIYCSNQITMTVLDCISHKERFIQLKAPIYFVPYLSLWKQLNDILWLYIFDITSLTNFQTLIYPYHKYHYSPTSNCFFISFLISPFLILSCCLFILFTFICASVIKSISFFSIISLSPKYLVL